MRNPKCRTCGKEHALGGCPEFKSTAPMESRPSRSKSANENLPVGTNPVVAQRIERVASNFEVAGSRPADRANSHLAIGVDLGSKDFGAKVIGRVMEDGRIEILSLTHSKAQFNKAEYQRKYMADKRTIKRLGLNCTVSEYRKQKEK